MLRISTSAGSVLGKACMRSNLSWFVILYLSRPRPGISLTKVDKNSIMHFICAVVVKVNKLSKGGPRVSLYESCKKLQWPMPTFEFVEVKPR